MYISISENNKLFRKLRLYGIRIWHKYNNQWLPSYKYQQFCYYFQHYIVSVSSICSYHYHRFSGDIFNFVKCRNMLNLKIGQETMNISLDVYFLPSEEKVIGQSKIASPVQPWVNLVNNCKNKVWSAIGLKADIKKDNLPFGI